MKSGKPSPADPDSQSALAPGLYITATPIGCARDITLRALEVLKGCDIVAAEDTRVTAKLFALHGLAKSMRSYNDHNAASERPKLLERLRGGARIALVSDAGTPLVSDPGFKLVRDAVAEGIAVHTVPGPCAALAGLTIAGLPTDRFFFAGFPPPRAGERQRFLGELKGVRATLIFYEAPQRLAESLRDMAEVFGPRPAVVARELTKLHEETRRADLASLAESYEEPPRGEVTILVGGPVEQAPDFAKADALLDRALAFMPVRAAADLVAEALTLPRRELYARALARKELQQ